MAEVNRKNDESTIRTDPDAKEDSLDRGSNLNKSQDDAKGAEIHSDGENSASSEKGGESSGSEVDSRVKVAERSIQRLLDTAYDRNDNLVAGLDTVSLLREIETAAKITLDQKKIQKYEFPAKYDVQKTLQDISGLLSQGEEVSPREHAVDAASSTLEGILNGYYDESGDKKNDAKDSEAIQKIAEELNVDFLPEDEKKFTLPLKMNLKSILEEVKAIYNRSPDAAEKDEKLGRLPKLFTQHENQIKEIFKGYATGDEGKVPIDELPAVLGDVLDATDIKIVSEKDSAVVLNSAVDDAQTFFNSRSQVEESKETTDKKEEIEEKKAEEKKEESKKEGSTTKDEEAKKAESDDAGKKEESKEEKKENVTGEEKKGDDDGDKKESVKAEEEKKESTGDDSQEGGDDKAAAAKSNTTANLVDFNEFQGIFNIWADRNHRDLDVPESEAEVDSGDEGRPKNAGEEDEGAGSGDTEEEGEQSLSEKEMLRRQLQQNIDEYEEIYDQKLIRGEDISATRKILDTLNQQLEDLDHPEEEQVEESARPKKKLSEEEKERRKLKGFQEIFGFYCKQHMMGIGKTSFDQINAGYRSITLGDYFKFVKDFELNLPYIRRPEMIIVYNQAAGDNKKMEFEEFVDSFTKLAEMVSAKSAEDASKQDDPDLLLSFDEVLTDIMKKVDPLRPVQFRKKMVGYVLPFGSQTSVNARIPKDSLSYKYKPKKHNGLSHDEMIVNMKDREERSKRVIENRKENEQEVFKTKRSALLRPIRNPVDNKIREGEDRKAKIRRSYKTLRDKKLEEDEKKKVTLKGLSSLDYNDIVKGDRDDDTFKPMDLIDSDDDDDEALNFYKIEIPNTSAMNNGVNSTNVSKLNTDRKKGGAGKGSKSVDRTRALTKNSSVPQLSMAEERTTLHGIQSEMTSPKQIMDNKAKGGFSSTGKSTKPRGLKKTPAHLRSSDPNLLELGGTQAQSVKAKKLNRRQMNEALESNSMHNISGDVGGRNMYMGNYDQYYAGQGYGGGAGYGPGPMGGAGGMSGYNQPGAGMYGAGGYGVNQSYGGGAGGYASGYPQSNYGGGYPQGGGRQSEISNKILARAGQIDNQLNERNQNMLKMHDQKMNRRMGAVKKIHASQGG